MRFNSDQEKKSKMDANQTFEVLLSYIKKSNLNWSIAESTFSVTVTLKKSFIKNKDGSLRETGLETSTFTINSTSSPVKVHCPIIKPDRTISTNMQQALANPTRLKLQQFPLPASYEEKFAKPNITRINGQQDPSISKQEKLTIFDKQFTLPHINNILLQTLPNQFVNHTPIINTFPSSLKQQALMKPSPSKNTLSPCLQQLALDNPYLTENTFSNTFQQQALVNHNPTINTSHSSLQEQVLVNPYPTKNTFSTSQQALLNSNSYPTNLSQQALVNSNPSPTRTPPSPAFLP